MKQQCEEKEDRLSLFRRCCNRVGNKVDISYRTSILLIMVFVLLRILICVKYTILSGSMLPSIQVGESVCISKLLYGWRIKSFWTNSSDKFYRIPGIRKIVPGDIIVFNAPFSEYNIGTIRFNPDMKYCKRVLGTPGDRIGTVDGHCWNDKVLRPIGVLEEQNKLSWIFDSLFIWRQTYNVIPMKELSWNIKNWGPLIVPQKGLSIELDTFSLELYRPIIEYETGEVLSEQMFEYTFNKNYFYVVGDNVIDSYDSRYWGFIPEDYIIGIVHINTKKRRMKK